MTRFDGIRRIFRLHPTRRSVAREVDDELRFHLDARAAELRRSGVFAAVGSAEVWVPIDRSVAMRERRSVHWLKPVARLRDGVTVEAARRDVSRIARDLAREYPESNAGQDATAVPLRDELVGPMRPLLLTLYGAVAFLLLVACGNVANLLLMRGASRGREMALRAALGAGRRRIARQLLTESGLLALAGGALGVAVAHLAIRGLVAAILPEQARMLPYLRDVGVSGVVLGYTMLVSLLAGAATGLVPALRASRADLQSMLRQSGGGAQRRLRDGLVVAELALTVVLVSGAALFARSLTSLLAVRPGFHARGVLTMMVPLPRWKYASEAAQRRFYQALEERVAALPGGRTFGAGDDTAAAGVIIVNRTLARQAFGARDPIGRQLDIGRQNPRTIVGVGGDVAIGKLEDDIPPTIYFSHLQAMDVSMRLAVRTAPDGSPPSGRAPPPAGA